MGAAAYHGGRDGHRYGYNHADGPFCSHRIAYVVPHRGKQLAIEFPSTGRLDSVQKRVLCSLRFLAEDAEIPSAE